MIDLSSLMRRIEEAAGDDRVAHLTAMINTKEGYKAGVPIEKFTNLEPLLRDLLSDAFQRGVLAHVNASQGGPEPHDPYKE